jgi:outer membrane protein assembly factor BamD (BamD/ComL family)
MKNDLFIAILLSTCASQKQFKQANSIADYKNYIEMYPDSRQARTAEIILDNLYAEKAWKDAEARNTIGAHQGFLQKYPVNIHAMEAEQMIYQLKEEQAWNAAKSSNTIAAFQKFVSDFPGSEHVADALGIIEELRLGQEWYIATGFNTIPALEEFLKNNPISKYEQEAQDKIKYLEKYNANWEDVKAENSMESYRSFIEQYPETAFADLAVIAILEIEKAIWENVIEENTIETYQQFIEDHPDSEYAELAEKRIIDLEVDKVFRGNYGQMPSMQKTGYGSKSTNEIEVYNNTAYTLTVLYSGPASKKIILATRERIEFDLPNEKYRIAASVSATNVSNFAGKEDLSGGSYEIEYYIYTSRY